MNIYIASSWRNQHAVQLLSAELRRRGHLVASFVDEAIRREGKELDFKRDIDQWIESDAGRTKYNYDRQHAVSANIVIYIGPSGCDAWAEVGLAAGADVPILGLLSKGETIGLMRHIVTWYRTADDLLAALTTNERN
jgi:hypothetical protein